MSIVTIPVALEDGASVKAVMRFNGPHYFLSNMFPCTIILPAEDDCPEFEYESLEAAYQAAKTLDPATRQRMVNMSGKDAKAFAHRDTFPLRFDYTDDWRLLTMTILLAQKFSGQTKETRNLARKLLATGNALLIEGNDWDDMFFGVCLKTGSGENNLGQGLMARREELVEVGASLIQAV